MKKLIVALMIAALLIPAGFAMARTGLDKDSGTIGQKSYDWSPERTFRWVRYIPSANDGRANATTLTADSIVIWDVVSDDGVTVTTTTTSGDNAVAGVIPNAMLTPESDTLIGAGADDSYGSRNWGWLQTYGKADVVVQVNGYVAVDEGFGTGTVQGRANTFTWGYDSVTNGIKRGHAGFAYDAISGSESTTGQVFLRCD